MSDAPPLFPSERRVRKNPFSKRAGKDRESFPAFEDAFTVASPDDANNNNNSDHQSECSSLSVLNMSIGARAALNEHLRHVAKYGIDDEGREQAFDEDEDEDEDDDQDHSPTNNTLDAQWNYLLDDHSSQVNTTSGSFAGVSCLFTNPGETETSGLESSIDAMTDVSQNDDYFNSSRVQMLATPERNRDRLDHVMTREEVATQEPYEDSFDQFVGSSSDTSSSSHHQHVAPELKFSQLSISERNSSFQSLSAVDISRISNVDSEPRKSPDDSLIGDDAPFSPILLDIDPPCNKCLDSSFGSISRRSSPSKQDNLSCAVNASDKENATQNIGFSAAKKKNTYPDGDNSFSESLHTAKETITQQGSTAMRSKFRLGYPQNVGTSDIPATDSMPMDFLRAIMESTPVEAPSPISQIDSHVGHEETWSKDSSSQRQRSNNGTSSSPSSIPSLTGRKRFRTVVPRRVYMDSSSPSKFPEEYDSFSTPSAEKSEESAQRSLLDSFEAVYDH